MMDRARWLRISLTWRSHAYVQKYEHALIFLSINGLGTDICLGKALCAIYVNIPIFRVHDPAIRLTTVTLYLPICYGCRYVFGTCWHMICSLKN